MQDGSPATGSAGAVEACRARSNPTGGGRQAHRGEGAEVEGAESGQDGKGDAATDVSDLQGVRT
ncbi:hypothetical protein GCM10009843_10460 [Nocardioides bigeumensis]|uniref:Uncharacterized protein n=1 Tax=Nocardioides bigeumensis TaxID=433657 RepID=A0ABN2XZ27_9ACTN